MTLKNTVIIEKGINISLNILIILFSIVLLISLYTGLQVKVLKHKYANFFGYSLFEVQTNSMEDTIVEGDWIVVKLTQKVKLEDVITYESKGNYITHRVVETYGSTYITQGDANNGKDEPIDQKQIVGKMVKVLGGFGVLRKTLFNPAVLVTLIITLFLFNFFLKKEKAENRSNSNIKTKELLLNFLKVIKEQLQRIKKTKISKEELNLPSSEADSVKVEHLNVSEEPTLEIEEEWLMPAIKTEDSFEQEIIIEADDLEQEEPYVEDELDKTMFFRVIPVDVRELDETRLEIAQNEMAEETPKIKEPESELEIEENIEDEGLTKIDLELINSNTKKNKNVIDAMINIKKEELAEIISVIIGDERTKLNEATIKNAFAITYIHAKYYNYYNEKDVDSRGKNFSSKMEKVIQLLSKELISSYKGNDSNYEEKVNTYAKLLQLITNLEQAKDLVTDIKSKREFYKSEIVNNYPTWDNLRIETVANEIIRIQKSYLEIVKYFLKKLETNTFYLELNKIASKKDWYATDLQHNISFNKAYSDYIIDKTYTEGIIAENKINVFITVLLGQLSKDMIAADFNKKYVIYLPNSLYKKEKKLWRILRMYDDEYAKAHVMILVTFEELILNKAIIKKVRKAGYRFTLVLESEDKLLQERRSSLYMVEAIFISRKEENIDKIIAYIPEDIRDNIIYDDIIIKISSIEVNNE